MAAVDPDYEDLRVRVTALETTMSSVLSDLNAFQAAIEGFYNELADETSARESADDSLSSRISSLSSTVSSLQTYVNSVSGSVSSQNTKINELTTRVTALENNPGGTGSGMSNSTVSELNEKIRRVDANYYDKFNSLETRVNTFLAKFKGGK